MVIDLRPFQPGDSAGIAAVIDEICRTTPYMATRRFEVDGGWRHALAEPGCQCHALIVACDGDRPAGWCRVFPLSGESGAELGIGLLPYLWGCGHGQAMVRAAQKWAAGHGIDQVRLSVHPANARALHCFERCGFRTTDSSDPGVRRMTWRGEG